MHTVQAKLVHRSGGENGVPGTQQTFSEGGIRAEKSIGQGHYSKGKSQLFSSVCFSLHLFWVLGAAISIRNLKLRHDLCPQSKEEDTDNTYLLAVPQATWQDLWY